MIGFAKKSQDFLPLDHQKKMLFEKLPYIQHILSVEKRTTSKIVLNYLHCSDLLDLFFGTFCITFFISCVVKTEIQGVTERHPD